MKLIEFGLKVLHLLPVPQIYLGCDLFPQILCERSVLKEDPHSPTALAQPPPSAPGTAGSPPTSGSGLIVWF